jgi:SulP family sulfate permease
VLDLKHAKVMDYSAIEAIDSVAQKYKALNKDFIITRPGDNCRALLNNADNITSFTINEDYFPVNEA